DRFGIIQLSLIDTWAATSAGAYVLTENGLYTKEAWISFMRHLTPNGILTLSRWYYDPQPSETLRLASLATASLSDLGVQNPRRHVIIVRKPDPSGIGVATILISPQPFTDSDVERIVKISAEMQFIPILTPEYAERPELEAMMSPNSYAQLIRNYHLNIGAPT